MKKPAIVLGACVSLLSGCPFLEVEVEVPELCLTYANVQVDGFDAGDGVMTVHESLVIDDLSAVHRITDLDADVSFVRAELLALAGLDSFEFVDAARITLSLGDGSTSLPPLTLYQCDGDCVPADGLLDMTPAAQHDALAYLRADSIVLDVELTGRLPRESWTMSVAVCFETSATYSP